MLALFLALQLAQTPVPHALPRSDVVAFAPKLSALSGLHEFMERAGERSALMRPSTYSTDFHPLLSVDPFRPESLQLAGIDPAGPATVSERGDTHVTCTQLSDVKLFERRATERLTAEGTVTSKRAEGGVALKAAQRETLYPAAYLLKGHEACAISGTSITSSTLTELTHWMAHPPDPPSPHRSGLLGALFLWTRGGVVGADGTRDKLTLDARSTSSHLPLVLASPAPTAAASVPPSGVVFVRARSLPGPLAQTAMGQLGLVCQRCQTPGWGKFFAALSSALTGEVLARVDRVRVDAPLSDPAGRFFALKQATLFELKQAQGVKDALTALAKEEGLPTTADGVKVTIGAGVLSAGVRGRFLYATTDEGALEAVKPAFTAKASTPAHALEVALDSRALAQALGQISLLDIVADQKLIGLFAASTELGPLLSVSAPIHVWAEPQSGGTHVHLTWELQRP
jgi:hypothetical protein